MIITLSILLHITSMYVYKCGCMHVCNVPIHYTQTGTVHTYVHTRTDTYNMLRHTDRQTDIHIYIYNYRHIYTHIYTHRHNTQTHRHTHQSYINKLDDDCSTFNSSKLLHDITDGPLSDSTMECYCFL